MTDLVYEFDCECCEGRREECVKGKQRYRYFWNGLEFADVGAWAAVVGLPVNTLRGRLKKGFCLQAEVGSLREELIANRREPSSAVDPCAALAAQFCRVMARTMRAA